jgi:hypothetical protein
MSEWDALHFITSGCTDRDACRHAGVNYGLFFLATGADRRFARAYRAAKLVRDDILRHRPKSRSSDSV